MADDVENEDTHEEPEGNSRRDFLRGAAVTGVAAGALLTSGEAMARGGGRHIEVALQDGMPSVQVEGTQVFKGEIALSEELSKAVADQKAADSPLQLTLEAIDVELEHNQSYGMVQASTGCISNPGGPGC